MKTLFKPAPTSPPPVDWESRFALRTAQMKRSTVREFVKFTSRPGMISFAGGLPAPEFLPVDALQQAAARVLEKRGKQALQYGESEGVAELRDWLADHHRRRGLRITQANVLIFSGAQQALDLLGRVLLQRGDKVIVENPTYLALLSAWRPLGVEFLAAPMDSQGILPGALVPLLRQKPKLLYTIPTFQNPTGATLSHSRRADVVELLRKHRVGIVEDEPYHQLRYEGPALPHLVELDAHSTASGSLDTNTIHVGTFSKVLAPGLRIGWVIGPEALLDKLIQAKQSADLQTSTFNQLIALEMLNSGFLDTQIPRLCAAYRERRDTMLAALSKFLPRTVSWTRPDGGMFLMATLPPH